MDPILLPAPSAAEAAFWAADFDNMLTSNAILLSLRATYNRTYAADWYGELEPEWRGLWLAAHSIHHYKYDEAMDILSLCAGSVHPYVRVMVPYYSAWSQWSSGLPVENTIPCDTAFGRAMHISVQAWVAQRRGDFGKHLQLLHDAILAFFQCDPIPVYWIARLLSPAMTVAFERGDVAMMRSLEQLFHATEWTPAIEHERFDCLRAMARLAFICNDPDAALKHITAAKNADLPGSCRAHAHLHCASFAIHAGERLWSVDQIAMAQALIEETPYDTCPDYRSVMLGMALQLSYVKPDRATIWLKRYIETPADANNSLAHDGRLDAIANISIAKVSNDNASIEMLSRSYDLLAGYGYHYRAAQAAAIIAPRERRKTARKEWAAKAIEHISTYGDNSPMRRALEKELTCTHFTPREIEVANLLSASVTQSEIAERLNVSKSYVKHLTEALFRKLEVGNRMDFVKKWGR